MSDEPMTPEKLEEIRKLITRQFANATKESKAEVIAAMKGGKNRSVSLEEDEVVYKGLQFLSFVEGLTKLNNFPDPNLPDPNLPKEVVDKYMKGLRERIDTEISSNPIVGIAAMEKLKLVELAIHDIGYEPTAPLPTPKQEQGSERFK